MSPMKLEKDETIDCPYCGESVGIVVDCTLASQEFVEDCQVCCRPIQYLIVVDDAGEIVQLQATSEDG